MSALVVAVDGPAGSGKSSVSKQVARELGFAYLDTGAAYRALAWYESGAGVDLEDPAAVVAALPGFDYAVSTDPGEFWVRVGTVDVTEAIRDPAVSAVVSAVARVPEVRVFLNELFRRIAAESERPGIVIEGRDITTVVAPDAPVRILLTAREEVRAARRAGELSGTAAAGAAAAIARRDAADSKVVDFLTAADGVTTVDSTRLDFAQTVAAVEAVVRAAE